MGRSVRGREAVAEQRRDTRGSEKDARTLESSSKRSAMLAALSRVALKGCDGAGGVRVSDSRVVVTAKCGGRRCAAYVEQVHNVAALLHNGVLAVVVHCETGKGG